MVDATVLLIRETYCGGYRYPETLFGTMFPNPTFKLNNNMNLLGIWIRGRCLCDSQSELLLPAAAPVSKRYTKTLL